MRTHLAALAAGAVLAAGAAPAAAEINVADSIEWMTADSDLVVRGTIADVARRPGPGSVVWYDVTVRVAETIKGPRRRVAHFSWRYLWGPTPTDWKAHGDELLLFLVDGKRRAGDDQAFASVGYTFRDGTTGWVVLGDPGPDRVYDTSFAALDRRADVLAATRAAASATGVHASHRVDVPFGSPAFQSLYGGSAVWLIVPVDARLERLARTWLTDRDLDRRVEGVRALAHFRSRGNTQRLLRLLGDPDFATVSNGNAPGVHRYLARAAADEVLTGWRVAHTTPVIEEPAAP